MGTHAPLTADQVIDLLGLEVLPLEGGSFRETYRAAGTIPAAALPDHETTAPRHHSTQIYYLLRAGETSALHRVRSDEVFHHYMGDRVRQLLIGPGPDGTAAAREWHLGNDLAEGDRPQRVVPAGVWQGACLEPGGRHGFALLGCTVSPGFDWDDFELIDRPTAERLVSAFPAHERLIRTLTPVDGRSRA